MVAVLPLVACAVIVGIAVGLVVLSEVESGGTALADSLGATGWALAGAVWVPWSAAGWLARGLAVALGIAGLVGVVRHCTAHDLHVAAGSATTWSGLGLTLFAVVVVVRNLMGPRGHGSFRLGAPLAGGTFMVGQGGDRLVNHHFASPAQRFALDIVGVRAIGPRTRRLLPRRLDDFLIMGAPVVAPVAGRVVATFDGLDDLGATSPAAGNHVTVEPVGQEGWRVVLAHLKVGSVEVAEGDELAAGQIVGRVGDSGNSTEPHLHLHVEDAQHQGVPMLLPGHRRPLARNSLLWRLGQP
jgi:hypothetical protein